jgi:UDP:flavonoid glycosyltransferase YjiC (YdhE family)
MRAVLTNFGSTGSVYPFISMAIELRNHGHQPVVALSPFFSSWVERFGLDFVPVGPDLRKVQYDINEAMLDLPDSEDEIREMFAPLMFALPQMFEELRDACRNADVLVSGPWQPASPMIHELTGIPFVTIQNSHFGGGGTPAFQRASASLINPFRARHGLAPVRNPLTNDANSPQLVVYNMSRHVRPPLPDWPPHYHMPGYLFLNEEGWRPDPSLEDFIGAGEPPVVITFGSMTHDDPAALTGLLVEAVRQARCRAIIQQGWSGLARHTDPSIFITDFIPHDWLFMRSSCVVHHGGAGTAASVFRAGVPGVFVPHTFDHPLWAQFAYDLGCAGPPIPFLELGPERLGLAIRAALDSPGLRRSAAELGRRIRAEMGLSKARQLIEELVRRVSMFESRAYPGAIVEEQEERMTRRKEFQQRQRHKKLTTR